MTVNDVVIQLKYGELKGLALKNDIEAIISYLNLALIAVYGRFKIRRGEQIIDLIDNISLYDLDPDCMYIEGVYGEDGLPLLLNDDDNIYSVYTPSYDVLQVPNAATGSQISVLYVENPTALLYTDDTTTKALEILLPASLLEPLLHYIGYRAHGALNGDIKAENNTHLMRYEASCNRILQLGTYRIDVVPASVSLKEGIDSNE